MESEHEPNWKESVLYAASWFIASLLLVLCLLSTIEFTNTVMVRIASTITDGVKRLNFGETKTAIIEGMYFIGGVSAIGLAIWIEYYFRKGEKIGKLVQRVVKVLAIEIILAIILNAGIVVVQLI